MIYGYIRTSTDKQNNENQHFEIEQFAQSNNITIDQWVEETISSRKSLDERKLGKLLKKIKQDDIIIASELSRLGRNLLQVMSILHHCMNIGCQVWTIKENYRLGNDIQSKVMAFAFGLSAEKSLLMIFSTSEVISPLYELYLPVFLTFTTRSSSCIILRIIFSEIMRPFLFNTA